ncbi:FkbM family methyltransferase [Flavobacterium pallidum]|uniref:FkbM family methyltransferase n=1 Tax=Flavobacterium pallidum TaxID=2172098 RepID=A0A2S1SGY3_9FLAO|nr:FkbM family methyltransferase [Flavobacterium pallidum]AWI25676.1 FkbM family methyltransferase [Flavobacterium pallidum]
MNKKVKKIISFFFPKGILKDKIKLFFYNALKPKNISFGLKTGLPGTIYRTTYKDITLFTHEALYHIADDFNYYQHFYNVKDGDVVIDAGANCGHLTVLFSAYAGQNGKVYAFEPDSINIKRISENMALNENFPKNIRIEELLLWNENKKIGFYEAGTVASSAIYVPDDAKCVQKDAVTIDSWCETNNIGRLDFIKMDIEGAEIEALDGCKKTIAELSPNFAIASYHMVNGEMTYIKVEDFFRRLDYPFKTVRFRGNEIITFAGPAIK